MSDVVLSVALAAGLVCIGSILTAVGSRRAERRFDIDAMIRWVIIGVLAAIAVPSFFTYQRRWQAGEVAPVLARIARASRSTSLQAPQTGSTRNGCTAASGNAEIRQRLGVLLPADVPWVFSLRIVNTADTVRWFVCQARHTHRGTSVYYIVDEKGNAFESGSDWAAGLNHTEYVHGTYTDDSGRWPDLPAQMQ